MNGSNNVEAQRRRGVETIDLIDALKEVNAAAAPRFPFAFI